MPASDVTVTAIFKAIDYKITVDTDTNKGTVNVTGTPNVGKPIEINVTPKEGYEVDGKITAVDKDNNPITVKEDNSFTMPASDVTVKVTFKQKEYNVEIEKSENGSVEANPKSGVAGTTIALDIRPETGYELETITATDGEGQEVPVDKENKNFTMPTSDVTVTAIFKKSEFTISVVIDGEGKGTATASKGKATLGDAVNITLNPDNTSKLEAIDVRTADGKTVALNDNSFTMPASNVIVEVIFRKKADIVINFNELWINDSYIESFPLTFKEDSIWKYSKETFNLLGNEMPLKRKGFEFLGWKTEDGRLITESFKVTIEMNQMHLYAQWKDLNQDEQDYLKEQFEEAFKTSTLIIKDKDFANLGIDYKEKTVTVVPAEMDDFDITEYNVINELQKLVKENFLAGYTINSQTRDLNSSLSENQMLEYLIQDFAAIANVTVSGLDYSNKSQVSDKVKEILTALANSDNTVEITVNLAKDNVKTTDVYKFIFMNYKDMTPRVIASIDNSFDKLMQNTANSVKKQGRWIQDPTDENNNIKARVFQPEYDGNQNVYTIKINTIFNTLKATKTARTGFKTAVVNFLTGMNVGKRKVQGNLQKVKITQVNTGKSVTIGKEQLIKINGVTLGNLQQLLEPFAFIFMPDGKSIDTLILEDFLGQEATFEYTYVNEKNEAYKVTRTLKFGSFTSLESVVN